MKFFMILPLLFSMNAFSATQLDDLIRGEMAAVKAYDTLLKDLKTSPEKNRLMGIRNDHQNAVDSLSKYVAGKAEVINDTQSAGAWGTFATTWTKGAKLMGNETALKALQTGEEHGIREYKEALNDKAIDQKLKERIKVEMLPRQKGHIDALKAFM